jgi:hypothetical protein
MRNVYTLKLYTFLDDSRTSCRIKLNRPILGSIDKIDVILPGTASYTSIDQACNGAAATFQNKPIKTRINPRYTKILFLSILWEIV